MQPSNLVCYVDGGCLGNGKVEGSMYGSFKVFKDGILISENLRFPLINGASKATNNIAEARSLHTLLIHLNDVNFHDVEHCNTTILMDSDLVIKQIRGIYTIKNKNMYEVYKSIFLTLDRCGKMAYDHLTFEHIPGTKMKEILGH